MPETSPDELLLIDLSSLAHPLFHMATDPQTVHVQLVDRIRALASSHPHAAICCDSGKSFRADIDPTYKANRPESEAVLRHEIALACDTLRDDGFPVWFVPRFEADDIIASATYRALEIPDTTVLIASADKDLLALVNGRVRAKSLRDGSILDEAAVYAKLNVLPRQVADYLALVGDKSDNITGAAGIGAVKAANLLGTFGTLDDAYAAIDRGEAALPAAVKKSLVEFSYRLQTVRQLVALKTDVPLPFHEIALDRVPKMYEGTTEMSDDMELLERLQPEPTQKTYDGYSSPEQRIATMTDGVRERVAVMQEGMTQAREALDGYRQKQAPRTATEIQAPDVLAPVPVDPRWQLEPRSVPEARLVASDLFAARKFDGHGNAPSVLAVIMAGRELGLQAVASLRAFHVIDNKLALAADAMRGLVMRSEQCEYFRCVTRTPDLATFETKRKGEPEPTTLSYSIEEGRSAFQGDDRKWAASGWGKHPADMLAARASSKLCRLVYADVLFGLYCPEEVRD